MPATGIEPVLCHHNRILSPARLPVPPRGLLQIKNVLPPMFVSTAHELLTTDTYRTIHQWMEVDSNHRSNLQQIYSLSPLATRESIHNQDISHVLTNKYYSITQYITQAYFFRCKMIAERFCSVISK